MPLILVAALLFSSLVAGRATGAESLAVFGLIALTVVDGRFSRRRTATWVAMLVVWSASGFLGHILPWGQMSYWETAMLANLLGGIPLVGDRLAEWLYSSFSTDNSSFGWLPAIPSLFVCLDVSMATADRLHARPRRRSDLLAGVALAAALGVTLILLAGTAAPPPDTGGLLTPVAITPPLLFLPPYAVLRCVPDKALGVALMFAALLAPALWPAARADTVRRGRFAPLFYATCAVALLNWVALGVVGAMPPDRLTMTFAQALAAVHFAFFIGSVPLWRKLGAKHGRAPNLAVFE